MLHHQPMYLANNWGFVPVQAAIGVFTFWGPKVRLLQGLRQHVWAFLSAHCQMIHAAFTSDYGLRLCALKELRDPPLSQVLDNLSLQHLDPDYMMVKFLTWTQAAKEILRADDDTVSYLLAGLILGTGVVGTLGGGVLPVCSHVPPLHTMKTLLLRGPTLCTDLAARSV